MHLFVYLRHSSHPLGGRKPESFLEVLQATPADVHSSHGNQLSNLLGLAAAITSAPNGYLYLYLTIFTKFATPLPYQLVV